MTRETITRSAAWRTDKLYALFPHPVVFRGVSLTGRIDPITAQVEVVDGGHEVEITGEAFLLISDFTSRQMPPPRKWELITISEKTYAIAALTETPTYGEYTLRLTNPQTATMFS